MLHAFLATFLGTAVEFFETIVIAYAVVRSGHAREAWLAVAIGHLLVFTSALALQPLYQALPLQGLRLVAALLLTAMGLHWTQKSLRRLIAQRRPRWATDPLGRLAAMPGQATAGFSWLVFLAMFKSSLIEAGEILLIAVPIAAAGAPGLLVAAGVGSGIAAVLLGAWALHRRLQAVPEVRIKLVAGLVLLALGASWLAEQVLAGDFS